MNYYSAPTRQKLIEIISAIRERDKGAYIHYDQQKLEKSEYPIVVESNIKLKNHESVTALKKA